MKFPHIFCAWKVVKTFPYNEDNPVSPVSARVYQCEICSCLRYEVVDSYESQRAEQQAIDYIRAEKSIVKQLQAETDRLKALLEIAERVAKLEADQSTEVTS